MTGSDHAGEMAVPQVATPQTNVPWARTTPPVWLTRTERRRQIVEELPDWDPLPPGESKVRRPARDDV
ncbi:hypothetical protein [Micromonospora humida]|uniref:Uncharacterized protein n=1 Tax=Micromonospora humida TaxID=2809018 RepID=A0ABS2IN37_9ACTN|nr:hypothetical protein [Micromonospora humida]MBM7075756.1 hypothetical protein [Micromonospora humida]